MFVKTYSHHAVYDPTIKLVCQYSESRDFTERGALLNSSLIHTVSSVPNEQGLHAICVDKQFMTRKPYGMRDGLGERGDYFTVYINDEDYKKLLADV